MRGLDPSFSTFRPEWPLSAFAKDERTVYVARGRGPGTLDCTRYDRSYASLHELTLVAPGAAGGKTFDYRGLCVSPAPRGLDTYLRALEARSVTFRADVNTVALTMRTASGAIVVTPTQADDPSWPASSTPSYPVDSKWGVFPEADPLPDEPTQMPYASTLEQSAIRVVGTDANGQGLSILFREGQAGLLGTTLRPSDLHEPRLRALYAVVASPSGGAFAAGVDTTNTLVAVKLTASNGLDATFGTNGLLSLGAQSVTGAGTALDGQGRLLIAFSTGLDGATSVARLTSTGALDPSFGVAGVAAVPLLNPFGKHLDIFADAESAALVPGLVPDAGGPPIRGGIARIAASGQLDVAYGARGVASAPVRTLEGGQMRATPSRVLLTVTPGAAPCNGRVVLFVIENDNASFDASQAYAFTP